MNTEPEIKLATKRLAGPSIPDAEPEGWYARCFACGKLWWAPGKDGLLSSLEASRHLREPCSAGRFEIEYLGTPKTRANGLLIVDQNGEPYARFLLSTGQIDLWPVRSSGGARP